MQKISLEDKFGNVLINQKISLGMVNGEVKISLEDKTFIDFLEEINTFPFLCAAYDVSWWKATFLSFALFARGLLMFLVMLLIYSLQACNIIIDLPIKQKKSLLIDSNGTVKLADFGVSACLFDIGDRQRSINTFVGTPCWYISLSGLHFSAYYPFNLSRVNMDWSYQLGHVCQFSNLGHDVMFSGWLLRLCSSCMDMTFKEITYSSQKGRATLHRAINWAELERNKRQWWDTPYDCPV